MLFKRHNKDNRTSFIISSSKSEEAIIDGISDKDTISTILNNQYKKKILDIAPYHYIVTKDDFFEIKSSDLAHNDNSFLQAFNDDIRILITDENSLHERIDSVANAIAISSAKHSMLIYQSIVFSEYEKTQNEIQALQEICLRAIKLRNLMNPIMSICEHVIGDEIVINNKVVPISNRNGHTKLKLIANKYSFPLESLIEINKHLDPNSLTFTDTIFLPKTTTIIANNRILKAKKDAQFIYDRCNYNLVKEVNLVG